jgi:mannose-6-phosphate isomerase-like protein (cupin superfamily)
VTGQDENGQSRVARVEEVRRADYCYVLPGVPEWEAAERDGYYRIWGTDQLPLPLPNDGLIPVIDSEPARDEVIQALQRMGASPPPLGVRVAWMSSAGPQPPGEMHWHDSSEVYFIMAGERGQILDGGQEHVLRAGDVQVQYGTNHSHERLGDEPCIIGNVGVGALRVGPYPPIESMHPVQRGPVGGHRTGERRNKQPMPPWTTTKPEPGVYRGMRGVQPINEITAPRRVIIGQNHDGGSYISRSEYARPGDAYSGLGEFWPIWGADRLPLLLPSPATTPPLDGVRPGQELDALADLTLVSPPLGYRTGVVRLSPSAQPAPTQPHEGMEVVFVMSGRVVLRLDSGEQFDVRAGDCVIHNGTTYSWQNAFDTPAMLGITAFGGFRRDVHARLAS